MSAVGIAAWIAAMSLLTAAAFGILPFFTIFLPIPLLLPAALYDSWREQRDKGKRKGDLSRRSDTSRSNPGRRPLGYGSRRQ